MIALIKTLHIAALVVWCATLVALPALLGLHQHVARQTHWVDVQHHYVRFRRFTHVTYTAVATPAAVLAIAAGTVLIFAAQVFEVWLLAKLVCVAGMALAHAWLGHLIVQSGERSVYWRMPWPGLSWLVTVPCMLAVLWLVLAKPDLQAAVQRLPAWSSQPLMLDVQPWLERWLPMLAPAQEVLP